MTENRIIKEYNQRELTYMAIIAVLTVTLVVVFMVFVAAKPIAVA